MFKISYKGCQTFSVRQALWIIQLREKPKIIKIEQNNYVYVNKGSSYNF